MTDISKETMDKYNKKLAEVNEEFGFTIGAEAFITPQGAIKARAVAMPLKEKEKPQNDGEETTKE